MKTFASLINTLESTNKVNPKLTAIGQFLDQANEREKLWLLALFSGRKPKRTVPTAAMKQWVLEVTGLPEWLFNESYSAVGDLGETIALLLPPPKEAVDKPLDQWMAEIISLQQFSEAEKKEYVLEAWSKLTTTERFIFNKLLGGSFRIGLAAKSMINALAKYFNIEASTVAHSVMGEWDINETSFEDLVKGKYVDSNASKPFPFCLAYPLEQEPEALGTLNEWQVEYKWDGIRGQIIKRNEEVFIWSRGEELVTQQFPELVSAVQQIAGNFVIDGEILVLRAGKVQAFNELQKRLNRKVVTEKLQSELPIGFYCYDILELEFEDLRQNPLSARRAKLELLWEQGVPANLQLSQSLSAATWADVATLRSKSSLHNSEGLMLKHLDSIYHAGRKKGDWWKWKNDPFSIDAVLLYAQRGSGRRSGYYTDYTFAVKDGDKLVTVAKAYSGLTDKEIQEVSRFVNRNAVEKFGPVRTVHPELVFEIGFEGITASSRHKSGVALRFPRILRWRKDKTVAEIDELETLKKMIKS
jgi:DNA ligase-1